MDLNLRKARKLEQKINDLIKERDFNTVTEVRLKSTVEQALDQISSDKEIFYKEVSRTAELVNLRFSIRKRIDKVNYTLGINDLMNEKELLNAKTELNVSLKNKAKAALSKEQLEDTMKMTAGALERSSSNYGLSATLATNILTTSELEDLKKEILDLKKQQENLDDQLSQKNLGGLVTLTPEEVILLQSEGLV